MSVNELSAQEGLSRSYFTRVLKLSFLAPDVTKSILQDRHSLQLNARRLVHNVDVVHRWKVQWSAWGFFAHEINTEKWD